jgi:hypothetical protein
MSVRPHLVCPVLVEKSEAEGNSFSPDDARHPNAKESRMSRLMLMQSILGHMALLEEKYPKKAASPVTQRAKKAVRLTLHPHPAAAKTLRRAA